MKAFKVLTMIACIIALAGLAGYFVQNAALGGTAATETSPPPSLLYPTFMNDRDLLEFWEQTECGDGFHLWRIEPPPEAHKIYHTCVACGKVVEYLY